MKQITVNVYEFSELPGKVKEKIRSKYWADPHYCDFIWQDAWNTLKKFEKIFPVKIESLNVLQGVNFHFNFDDNQQVLSGIRLMKYLWNNYKHDLFKGKYYSLESFNKKNHEIKHKRVKSKKLDNGNFFNAYHSAIQLDNCCVLTGVCYDDDLLDPVYDFLKNPKEHFDFKDLINECISSLEESIISEYNYKLSDEGLEEYFEANDIEFYENGSQF